MFVCAHLAEFDLSFQVFDVLRLVVNNWDQIVKGRQTGPSFL